VEFSLRSLTPKFGSHFLGDLDPMRLKLRMPRVAWSVVSLATMLSAGFIAGCDSGPNQAEVDKSKQERAEAIAKADAEDPGKFKKAGKKPAEVPKSIKGRLGGGQTGPE
jgi:hypothetical protein